MPSTPYSMVQRLETMLLTLWCRAGAGLGEPPKRWEEYGGGGRRGETGEAVLLLKTLERIRVLLPERPRQRGVEIIVTTGLRIGDCAPKTRTQGAGPTT